MFSGLSLVFHSISRSSAFILSLLLVFLASCGPKNESSSQALSIFAAASVRPAMEELQSSFEMSHPDIKLGVVYGSTGKAYAQIINDTPYEMLFAADMETPQKLIESGHASGKEVVYGTGRIAIWQRKGGTIEIRNGISSLKDPGVKSIAIANPEVAPYGRAAREALQKYGLWDSLKSRMVLGENLSQAAHFASSGSADLAIIAYAQVLSEDLKKNEGSFYLIDEADHHKLEQSFVILKKGVKNSSAHQFAAFVLSNAGSDILNKHGF